MMRNQNKNKGNKRNQGKNFLNRLMMLLLCLIVGVTATACQSGTQEKQPDKKSEKQEKQKENAQIPNPFKDYADMAAVKEAMGFDIVLPEKIEGYEQTLIQTDEEETLVQVFYEKDDQQILIRKAAKQSDISGDYNQYTKEETVTVGENTITLKGDADKYKLALWTAGEYSFSVSVTEGMSQEALTELVQAVK